MKAAPTGVISASTRRFSYNYEQLVHVMITANGFVYFNTRSEKFAMTDYLRKLNRAKSEVAACAEPTDALPSEADLKARLERRRLQFLADVTAERIEELPLVG